MARYHVDNSTINFANGSSQQLITTTYKTMTNLAASSASGVNIPRRGRIVACQVGPGMVGAPATNDTSIVWAIERQTLVGTITTATAAAVGAFSTVSGGQYDVASNTLCGTNASAEGTYAGFVWSRVLNQRASMQWVAQDVDAMLMWPGVSSAGFACLALSSGYTNQGIFGVDYEDL